MTGLHVWHFFNISFYLAGSIPISILKPSIWVFLGSYCLGFFVLFWKDAVLWKRQNLKYVNMVTKKKKSTQIHQAFLHFFWMVLLVTATFLLKSKPRTLFHSNTWREFFKQTFVRKWLFTCSFQHPLAHSIAASSKDFWAPYTSSTGTIARGQALDWDWDWSSKSPSPQGQSQPKSVSNLKFLRERFHFPLSQFTVSSVGATATFFEDRLWSGK